MCLTLLAVFSAVGLTLLKGYTVSSLSPGDYRVLYQNVSDFPPEMEDTGKKEDYQLFAIVRGVEQLPGRSTMIYLENRLPTCFHINKAGLVLGIVCPPDTLAQQ